MSIMDLNSDSFWGEGIVRGGRWIGEDDEEGWGKNGIRKRGRSSSNKTQSHNQLHYSFNREFVVRRQVLASVGTIRAKNSETPLLVIRLLEKILSDEAAAGSSGGENSAFGGELNQNQYVASECSEARSPTRSERRKRGANDGNEERSDE